MHTRKGHVAILGLIAVSALSACESVPDCIELSVSFRGGVSLDRVDEINDGIGAQVVRYPVLSSIYVVRLRHGQTAAEAIEYYESFLEVVAAGINAMPGPPLDGPDGARAVLGCLDAS